VAVPTRERLLDEAERLFARSGVQGVTSREIVEAAQQRNTSAVTYHFGTRDGLLLEILARRGGPVDQRRRELRDRLPARPSSRDLVECLVVPYVALLDSPAGRSYVQIVAQLRGRFAAWRVESDAATTRHLAGILDELESRPKTSVAVRQERVVGMIMLLTGAVAERAQRIDDGAGNETSDTHFVTNLVDMCTAVLTA
jgi:AcrR family transcriptional regulator